MDVRNKGIESDKKGNFLSSQKEDKQRTSTQKLKKQHYLHNSNKKLPTNKETKKTNKTKQKNPRFSEVKASAIWVLCSLVK